MEVFGIVQLGYVLRMAVAGICGILIGLERKNRAKEAGIRTHFVVACASALMMIISKYGFSDLARAADGARIAAQVVSGIGFLGAGMIFVHKNTVTGLTTAAGIWATAGVGLAVGGGMYTVGIGATFMIVFAQIILHKDFGWLRHSRPKKLVIREVDESGYQAKICAFLAEKGATVHDVSIEKLGQSATYTLRIELSPETSEEELVSGIEYPCKIGTNG